MGVLGRCALLIDGKAVAWRFDQIGVPPLDAIRRQAGTVQLFADAPFAPGRGRHKLVFRNGYRPARGPTTANIFASGAGHGVAFQDQQRSDDGRSFAVSVVVR